MGAEYMNHPACLFLLLITLNLLLFDTRPAILLWLYLIWLLHGWAYYPSLHSHWHFSRFTAVERSRPFFSDNVYGAASLLLPCFPRWHFISPTTPPQVILLSGYEQLFGQNPLGFGQARGER